GDDNQTVFLGRDFNTRNDLSDDTARKVDAEIRKLIEAALATANEILTSNRELLNKCSKTLLERETINGEEFKDLIEGRELPPLPAVKPLLNVIEAIEKSKDPANNHELAKPDNKNPDGRNYIKDA
ncbi:MAG TPA: hypothetical protein PKM56_20395, partial [Candidatus Rifleibacterium sp.]|nr:hypothetical protein [Candidatus Rifleibacterium sp.]